MWRSTLLPVVTLLSTLAAPPVSAHPTSGVVVNQKVGVLTDNDGNGFVWKIDSGVKRTLVQIGGCRASLLSRNAR